MTAARTPSDDELALADGLFRAMRLFKAVATSAAQATDIGSLERAGMLFRLKEGACRPGTLAHHGTRSPSAVTEIVEGLEEDGLVRREADPDDRRAVRVALTADGRRLIQRYENAAALALADRLGSLTSSRRQRLRAALADLSELLPKDFITSSHAESNVRQTTKATKEAVNAR
jgi:DNA-binding MarR family transcriptional regulator